MGSRIGKNRGVDDDLTPEELEQIQPEVLEEILQNALKAAALNCEQKGCNPPTSAEIQQALSA